VYFSLLLLFSAFVVGFYAPALTQPSPLFGCMCSFGSCDLYLAICEILAIPWPPLGCSYPLSEPFSEPLLRFLYDGRIKYLSYILDEIRRRLRAPTYMGKWPPLMAACNPFSATPQCA